ncbi:MAG: hypothetical protein ACTSYL_04475 [Candidatus Thorarchaeota archaeon]
MYPGKKEKQIRSIHITFGLFLMLMQLVLFSFDIVRWFHTTGLSVPAFIMIIGIVYGALPCDESIVVYLHRLIEPRVGHIAEWEQQRFLQFMKTIRVIFLLLGYVYLVIFQLIWSALVGISDGVIAGLFFIFPAFMMLVAVGATPFAKVLKRRYSDIKPILDADKAYARERARGVTRSSVNNPFL